MVYVDQRALFILYHPDYTVGYGISPYHARLACGLYRRWGITPRLEDQYQDSIVHPWEFAVYFYGTYYNA